MRASYLRFIGLAATVALTALGCGASDGDAGELDAAADAPARFCNGLQALCERSFNEVVLAGAHNAMSSEAEGFFAPNHRRTIPEQLDAGIRAMLIDTYRDNDGLALCHGDCFLGRTDAVEQLTAISLFLDANPNEVMAFIFEDSVDMRDSVALLEQSGLSARALVPPAPGEAWPTLAEMIDADTRVLLTHESGREGPPWFANAWDVFVDTPYSFEQPEDFRCAVNRGGLDRPLRLMNHWLSDPLPRPENAERVNGAALIVARADECATLWGALPTVIAVDFEDIGDVVGAVETLNAR